MTKDEAIKYFKTQAALGAALGCKQNTVSGWNEYPPDSRQLQIERVTLGALKAEPGCLDRVLGFKQAA